MKEKRIRKAVIPAAGYGTRFLPATKATPKEMLPIVDKPTIQYIVEEALESGIEDILIISGHGKRAIEDHFDSAPALEHELERKDKQDLLDLVRETTDVNVHYVRQKYMRGLGDAILCARSFVGSEPFAVLLGDMAQNIYRCLDEPFTSAAMLQILHEKCADVLSLDHFHDIFFAEQIVGGELDQGLHNTCAIAPENVRPMRYAKRTPEDCLHRKPVCKPPDRRRQKSVMNR